MFSIYHYKTRDDSIAFVNSFLHVGDCGFFFCGGRMFETRSFCVALAGLELVL